MMRVEKNKKLKQWMCSVLLFNYVWAKGAWAT